MDVSVTKVHRFDNLCNYSSTEEEILRIEGLNAVKSTNLLFATQQAMIKR